MKECSEVEGDKQEGGGGWVCMDHDASLWTTMAAAVVRFWKIASGSTPFSVFVKILSATCSYTDCSNIGVELLTIWLNLNF